MSLKKEIKEWIEEDLDSSIIKAKKFHTGITRWFILTVYREDQPNRFSYEYGYIGLKGKYVILTRKDLLSKGRILGLMTRYKNEFEFEKN
jgi:hypothetical protein